MRAWAPAHVIVETGSCVSLCGSGPVVMVSSKEDGHETKEKRIAEEERILQLLYPEGNVPADLIQGYHLVQSGDEAFGQEKFAQALALYEQAVNVAFRSAVELENERDSLLNKLGDGSNNPQTSTKTTTTTTTSRSKKTTRVPKGLEWLIRARRNEASCKLKLNDVDGAMLAAQASCNLSRNTSAESFLILAEIYKIEGGLEGEAQALEKAISLWNDDSVLTFPQKNQKRIASIRLQKVQREKTLAKPKVTPDDLVSLQQKPEATKNGKEIRTQPNKKVNTDKDNPEESNADIHAFLDGNLGDLKQERTRGNK